MIKGIFSAIGLMIALPFYCLYLIAKGTRRLFGIKSKPPKKKTSSDEFSLDELEAFDAFLDD